MLTTEQSAGHSHHPRILSSAAWECWTANSIRHWRAYPLGYGQLMERYCALLALMVTPPQLTAIFTNLSTPSLFLQAPRLSSVLEQRGTIFLSFTTITAPRSP